MRANCYATVFCRVVRCSWRTGASELGVHAVEQIAIGDPPCAPPFLITMYDNAMHCTAQCAIWVDWIYWPADMFCNVLWGIHECWEIAPLH